MMIAASTVTIVLIAVAGAFALVVRAMAEARRRQYRDEMGGFTMATKLEKQRAKKLGHAARETRTAALRRRRVEQAHGFALHGR